VKGGAALERPHVRGKEAEADRAAAVAVIDAVDQRRQSLAPVGVGREQVRLMQEGRNQVEQHNADRQRLVAGGPRPELLEARQQKAGVACLGETDLIPPAAEIGDP
jgi:hypothetical protein